MKFFEFFDRSTLARAGIKCLIVTGSDSTLKDMVVREYLKSLLFKGSVEDFKIHDLRDLLALWGEGSLFGLRVFNVILTNKIKNLDLWKDLSNCVKLSDHCMIIRFEADSPNLAELSHTPSFIAVIECKFPRTTKERIRLVDFWIRLRGFAADPDVTKEIAERIKTSNEMESVILSLELIYRVRHRITIRDVDYFLGRQSSSGVNSHALLNGNIAILNREIENLDPMLIVTAWFGILQRFYCWLCQEDRKSTAGDDRLTDGETDDGTDDEIRVNKYQLKDYRLAQRRYSLQRTRDVLEELNALYQDLRMGKSIGWKEKLRFTAHKLVTRS